MYILSQFKVKSQKQFIDRPLFNDVCLKHEVRKVSKPMKVTLFTPFQS